MEEDTIEVDATSKEELKKKLAEQDKPTEISVEDLLKK